MIVLISINQSDDSICWCQPIRVKHYLTNRDVRTSPGPESEPHDLSLGEDEEHDEGLDTNSNDDDHSNTTQLLRNLQHGWIKIFYFYL